MHIPVVKMRKCLIWETCLSKKVHCNLNVSQTGVWGQSPQPPEAMGGLGAPLGDFSYFSGK